MPKCRNAEIAEIAEIFRHFGNFGNFGISAFLVACRNLISAISAFRHAEIP